ncbi:hypothetical protein [Polyangium jinanense]|uniref:Lipoprotein n=1 Tax=Polyangium jinanense TaxID=2829994 RepID=A0A9X3X308_9BACT|nr:hypothetical protein [Polyangium jinanense]MDC3952812.1 hypothetical protein [Polyangium jinanense]MDC3980431.1 hypothetical protein [Polyangium jinanense]
MRLASLLLPAAVAATLAPACRGVPDTAKPDAQTSTDADAPSSGSNEAACLSLNTCGTWSGCVKARPQPLPFSVSPADPPITRGDWYRFDWDDRPNQVGDRRPICVGDAGACFEGLNHLIPCLPYFSPTAPDYRCEMIDGVCTKVAALTPPAQVR